MVWFAGKPAKVADAFTRLKRIYPADQPAKVVRVRAADAPRVADQAGEIEAETGALIDVRDTQVLILGPDECTEQAQARVAALLPQGVVDVKDEEEEWGSDVILSLHKDVLASLPPGKHHELEGDLGMFGQQWEVEVDLQQMVMRNGYPEAVAELENIFLFYFPEQTARFEIEADEQFCKSLSSGGVAVKNDRKRGVLWLSGPPRQLATAKRRVEQKQTQAAPPPKLDPPPRAADDPWGAPAEPDPWAKPAEPAPKPKPKPKPKADAGPVWAGISAAPPGGKGQDKQPGGKGGRTKAW